MADQYPYIRLHADDPRIPDVLTLIQESFAYMDGRIEPPSSMRTLTVKKIAEQCDDGEVWMLGDPPQACLFLKESDGRLYIGKLAVAENMRGQGLARNFVEFAGNRASTLGLKELELCVRIELTDNQITFAKLGFKEVSRHSHEGYSRLTYIMMRKSIEATPPPESF